MRDCAYCGRTYDPNEVKRTFGKFSSPYLQGLCSAHCYTKSTNHAGQENDMRAYIGRRLHTLLTKIKKAKDKHPNQEELIAIVKTIREEFRKRKTGGLIKEEIKGLNTVNKVYQDLNRRIIIRTTPGESGATIVTWRKDYENFINDL